MWWGQIPIEFVFDRQHLVPKQRLTHAVPDCLATLQGRGASRTVRFLVATVRRRLALGWNNFSICFGYLPTKYIIKAHEKNLSAYLYVHIPSPEWHVFNKIFYWTTASQLDVQN